MKKKVTIFALFIGVIGFAQSSKDAKIKEFINLTGVNKMAVQGVKQFIEVYKKNYKDIPSEFWDEFLKEASSDNLTELYAPIYAKYYTESDFDELIRFYKSPIGQKMITTMPALMNESMEIGREWGQKLAKKVTDKLETKYGYQSPPPPMQSKPQSK